MKYIRETTNPIYIATIEVEDIGISVEIENIDTKYKETLEMLPDTSIRAIDRYVKNFIKKAENEKQ